MEPEHGATGTAHKALVLSLNKILIVAENQPSKQPTHVHDRHHRVGFKSGNDNDKANEHNRIKIFEIERTFYKSGRKISAINLLSILRIRNRS